MINKAGELIDHIIEAVKGHGCTPHSEIRVRLGKLGPTYRIQGLTGQKDERGLRFILETEPAPETL